MEVLRPTAEALFSEKQEYHKRASSKDNESSDGNVNGSEGDSNNLAYSTISLNRYIMTFLRFDQYLIVQLLCTHRKRGCFSQKIGDVIHQQTVFVGLAK